MEQVALILLGLLVLAVVIQLATGGPDQARAWVSAKFLGTPA